MKKLGKKDLDEKSTIVGNLNNAASELAKAVENFNERKRIAFEVLKTRIDEFNAEIALGREKLGEAFADYNIAVGTAREFVERVVSEGNEYRDDRSEKWHESDAGEAHVNPDPMMLPDEESLTRKP